ncbi:Mur ligase family protein [Streptomyces sp. NPDC060334]|uniref:Mur ligase family protein n=1 Tax=Streptomyces sp. NPDC060334 TaxID=3347099 RepID=UPI0036537038
MRLANAVLIDRSGTRPVGSGVLTAGGLGCIRAEPAFVFEPASLTVAWSSEGSSNGQSLAVPVGRETPALFLPLPTRQVAGAATCAVEGPNLALALHLSVGETRSVSELLLAHWVRQVEDDYRTTYSEVYRLPFEEMLRSARSRLDTAGARLAYITGSVGKTSTKELLGYMLRAEPSYHTTDSWNYPHEHCAQIALNASWARIFVAELALGDHLWRIGNLLPPDVFVFTHVGRVHTKLFPTVTQIAATKAAAAAQLPDRGTAVINLDVPAVGAALDWVWRGRVRLPRVVGFSTRADSGARLVHDYNGHTGDITIHDTALRRRLTVSRELATITNPAHLAAAYGAFEALLGRPPEVEDVAGYAGVPRRLEETRVGSKILINDAWNANPLSLAALLSRLHEMRTSGARVCAFLGEMADLGEQQRQVHEQAVRDVPECVDTAVFVGRTYVDLVRPTDGQLVFESPESLLNSPLFETIIATHDALAVKGSYVTRMLGVAERVAAVAANTDRPEVAAPVPAT